jgi:hypothetical protein
MARPDGTSAFYLSGRHVARASPHAKLLNGMTAPVAAGMVGSATSRRRASELPNAAVLAQPLL